MDIMLDKKDKFLSPLLNSGGFFSWNISLGVKIRNLKVDFKTGGTWGRAMNTNNEYL